MEVSVDFSLLIQGQTCSYTLNLEFLDSVTNFVLQLLLWPMAAIAYVSRVKHGL